MTNNSSKAVILLAILFISCSTSGQINQKNSAPAEAGGHKTISVSAFTCPDPLVARSVQNAIIGSLLESLSVTVGGKADMA
ncbi:MAG: hypothetical protein AB1499_15325, partial [Nitrospirota bacterium]